MLRLFRVSHVLHLMCNRLQPCLHPLHETGHLRQLVADHGLLDQGLPEHFALEAPLVTLLHHQPRRAVRSGDDVPPLVVEVVHDALEAAVLRPQQVPHRNTDVVVRDQRSAGRGRVTRLYGLRLQALAPLHQQQRDAADARSPRAHRRHEVVGEVSVCDPLLEAVDDIESTACRLCRSTRQRRNVTPCLRPRDRQRNTLVAQKYLATHARGELGAAELQDGGQADNKAGAEAVAVPGDAQAAELLVRDELVKAVELLGGDAARQRHAARVHQILEPRAGLNATRQHASPSQLFPQLQRRVLSG
mmetsp:Transcript_17115/g.42225  ORF Transcript_17115/g.42225 Transcript_17115/m.42225 type:complete len:303 (+) Transcript_17115:394-1302(+)